MTGNRIDRAKSYFHIDILNVISMAAVVTLHTNYAKCYDVMSTSRSWYLSCILHSICSFAVPVFFMITGATLLDYGKRYSTKDFFKKRCSKTVIPFLFWSLAAFLFKLFYLHGIDASEVSFTYVLDGILNSRFNENYWYFITLFGVYLAIPLFGFIKDEDKEKVCFYALVTAFIFNILIPECVRVFGINIKWSIWQISVSEYLIYVFAGYYMNKKEFSDKQTHLIYTAGLVSVIALIAATVIQSSVRGEMVNEWRNPDSVTLFFMACSLFLFLKNNSERMMNNRLLNMLVVNLRDYTFGVYLLHWFVRRFLLHQFGWNDHNMIYCIFGAWLIILLCVCIIWLIRKVPFGRKIIP